MNVLNDPETVCLLHIGAPKTGSTALQAFLHANREVLQRQGWCYPDVSLRGYGHHDLAFLCGGGYPDWATPQPRSLAELVPELRAAVHGRSRVIISSENFYLLRRPAATASMLVESGIDLATVRVVVYLRRQDEAHLSWYNQTVKALGYSGTIEQSIARYHDLWDYEQNLDLWAQEFGSGNIIVRRYESDDLSRWDVRRDFVVLAGIADQELTWGEQPVNTRINRDLLELQRWFNRLPLSPQRKRRFHRELMALTAASAGRGIFGDAPLLDVERRARLLEQYAASNDRVAGKYLNAASLFDTGRIGGDLDPAATGAPLWRKLAFSGQWFMHGRQGGRHANGR